jgi:arginine-tRNA-protein transferase
VFQLRLVQSCPPSEEFVRTQEESLQVYRKYQVTIHNDPPEKVTMKQFLKFLINSPLEVITRLVIQYTGTYTQYFNLVTLYIIISLIII